jgi:serine/threonine protein kinase
MFGKFLITKLLYVVILKEFIGAGRLGKVYSVESPRFPKKIALKIIDINESLNKEQTLKILDSELRVAMVLAEKSPFLLKVVEYFIDGGYCFLVMEYCSGGNLNKVLEQNRQLNIKMSKMVL